MLDYFIVFCSQFFMVFFIGFQQQSIIHKQKILAVICSIIIGSFGYMTVSTVSIQANQSVAMGSCYACGGACGLYLSLLIHPYIGKVWDYISNIRK